MIIYNILLIYYLSLFFLEYLLLSLKQNKPLPMADVGQIFLFVPLTCKCDRARNK